MSRSVPLRSNGHRRRTTATPRIRWRAAQLTATPGSAETLDLGDVTVALSADGERMSGPVSNAGGDLAVRGDLVLAVPAQRHPAFARVDATASRQPRARPRAFDARPAGGRPAGASNGDRRCDEPLVAQTSARPPQGAAAVASPAAQAPTHPAPAGRIAAIDALRGFALCLMFVYHFAFDLRLYGVIAADFEHDPFWLGFRAVIVTMFMTLVGVSLVLADRHGATPGAFLAA